MGSIVTMLITQVKKLGSHQVQAKLVVGGADCYKAVKPHTPKPTALDSDPSSGGMPAQGYRDLVLVWRSAEPHCSFRAAQGQLPQENPEQSFPSALSSLSRPERFSTFPKDTQLSMAVSQRAQQIWLPGLCVLKISKDWDFLFRYS